MAGGCIVQRVDENLTYDYLHSSEDNLWSTLYLTGYLTKAREGDYKGTDDCIVAGVLPVADRLSFRIALQFQHVIHYVPRAVNIKVAKVVSIIPFLDIFSLLCQVSIL